MSPTQVYNIARREFIARVRNKWFILGTLLVPAMMSMMIVIPTLLQRADMPTLDLVILDAGTGAGDAVANLLAEVDDFELTIAEQRTIDVFEIDDVREELRVRILDEQIGGYVLLESDEDLGIRGRYFARETGNLIVMGTLERSIRRVALESYLEGSGLESSRVTALVAWDLDSVTISEDGDEEGGFERAYFSTILFTMVLYMTTLIGGQQMGQSIVEEKSTRLIELILGAVTSTEFIAGKIVGVLGAALLQLAIWIGLGFLVTMYVLPALALGAAASGNDIMEILDPTVIFYFGILFLLGYTLYAILYAAVASTCTSTEEFQQVQFPVMMPIILSFMFTFYAITNPSSTITRIVSLIPPATPLVMLARINVLKPPASEIWLGIGLLVLSCLFLIWAAAKMFRFTLLMSGKRPSFGTVLRLMRAA